MASVATLESNIGTITPDQELAAQLRWSTACVAGPLALRMFEALDETLGESGQVLASNFASIHRKTYEHGTRVALMCLATAEEFNWRPTGVQKQELVVAAYLHDSGKYEPDILPLTNFTGVFTDQQRARMKSHAAHSQAHLVRMAVKSQEQGHWLAADCFVFAAYAAGLHHTHDMALPRSNDDGETWRKLATTVLQIQDSSDALTANRAYVKERTQAENSGPSPLSVLDGLVEARFDEARSSWFIEATGMSPLEAAEIGLFAKLDAGCELSLSF